MLLDRRLFRAVDYPSLLILGLLLTVGVVLVASAGNEGNPALASKQMAWACLGWLTAIGLGCIDYRRFARRAYSIWLASVLALVWVLQFGPTISGAKSWVHMGGISFQPSEFAKIATILALAHFFGSGQARAFGISLLAIPTILVATPLTLTYLQPDLGTATTFVPILAIVSWIAGLRLRSLAAIMVIVAAAAPIAYAGLQDYQRARLATFLYPETDPLGDGYQIIQSKIAVGSGGLTGKGLFSGTQSQLHFLPEQHNDFIVGVLGEELGFIGVAVVLALYLMLLLRLLETAQLSQDRVGTLFAVGVVALLGFHVAINVGMVIGYAPITGIPLPLLSYGGSSTLASCIGIGTVIGIRTRRFLG